MLRRPAAAHHTDMMWFILVPLTGMVSLQMALRVLISIDQKIKASTAEREARKNFVIKDEGLIPIGEKVADAVEKPAN